MANIRVLVDDDNRYFTSIHSGNATNTYTYSTSNINDSFAQHLERLRRKAAEQERLEQELAFVTKNPVVASIIDTVLQSQGGENPPVQLELSSIGDRLPTAEFFLRWYWHFGHCAVAGAFDIPANPREMTRAFRKLIDVALYYGYVPRAQLAWYLDTESSKYTAAALEGLLEHPEVTARLRSFYRTYPHLYKMETARTYVPGGPTYSALTKFQVPVYVRQTSIALISILRNHGLAVDHALGPFMIGNDGKVGYYASTDKLVRDVLTFSTIGKALPHLVTPKAIWNTLSPTVRDGIVRQVSDLHRDHYATDDVHFLTEAADIIDAYQNSNASSCMSKGNLNYQSPVHPVTMYANCPGVALAVMKKPGGIRARCMTYVNPDDPDDKRYIRTYGDFTLQSKLERLGYKLGTLRGAKLKKIPGTLLNGTVLPHTWTTVYLDDMKNGGDHTYLFTYPELEHFEVCGSQDLPTLLVGYGRNTNQPYTFVQSRGVNGLIGMYASYLRTHDRQFKAKILGVEYVAPTSSRLNSEGEILCVSCNCVDVFEPGSLANVTRGRMWGGDFYCAACCGNVFVQALTQANPTRVEEIPMRYTFLRVPERTYVFDDPPLLRELDLVSLDPGRYPPSRHVFAGGRAVGGNRHAVQIQPLGEIAERSLTATLDGIATILKADLVVTLTGKRRHRNDVSLIGRHAPTDANIYADFNELFSTLRNGRLYVRDGTLVYFEKSPGKVLLAADDISGVVGACYEDHEDEPDINTLDGATSIPLFDVLCVLYGHIRSRNNGTLGGDRIQGLLVHQLAHFLPYTNKDVLDELVCQWHKDAARAELPALAQRLAHFERFFNTLPLASPSVVDPSSPRAA